MRSRGNPRHTCEETNSYKALLFENNIILQRSKALVYKDFMNILLTALLTFVPRGAIHLRPVAEDAEFRPFCKKKRETGAVKR